MRPDRAPLRTDLQGLRGLGVLLIVVGHLFLWPHGVFAALDIFFVLSGFVITELLVRNLGRHGHRFLPVFYLARARRLLPMALLVLAAGLWPEPLLALSHEAAQVLVQGDNR